MKLTDSEARLVRRMINEFKSKLVKDYPPGKFLRPLHPKLHGCVKATFQVEENIDPHFSEGIFQNKNSFDAVIRFSNSSSGFNPDKNKDVRGIAIKLFGNNDDIGFQDFILISHNRFITSSVLQYFKMLRAASRGILYLALFAVNPFNWKGFSRMIKSRSKCLNVLSIPYFSASPYKLGDKLIVKYAVYPATFIPDLFDENPSENYLRERLHQHLQKQDANFDFLIQLYQNPTNTPIDDQTVKWDAPFIKIATIHIPKQEVENPGESKCDKEYSFAPWHSLPEHEPISKINFIRKQVYEEIFQFRHPDSEQSKKV